MSSKMPSRSSDSTVNAKFLGFHHSSLLPMLLAIKLRALCVLGYTLPTEPQPQPYYGFDLHFLVISVLNINVLIGHLASLEKYLFKFFAHFELACLLLSCGGSLRILDTNLSGM